MPFILWMQAQGRPVEDCLRAVDLGYVLGKGPDLPIPLGPAIAFLRAASRTEGPDFASRAVGLASVGELGMIGGVALGARNVREALYRVADALPLHVTHEIISVGQAPGGIVIREAWGLRLDDEARHIVQQYVAALLQALCANAGAPLPVFTRVALTPHPEHGLSHLRNCFGAGVMPSAQKVMELFLPTAIADRPLPIAVMNRPSITPAMPAEPLRGDGTLSTSVQIIMAAMLFDGMVTVDRVASAAGMSRRTLQRRLKDEGNAFSGLLDAVRRESALRALATGDQSIGTTAGLLGYGHQSSLTRAVHRWAGTTPRDVSRNRGS